MQVRRTFGELMASDDQVEDQQHEVKNGRNPLLILAGFSLLGIALTLLMFGDSFFGSGDTTTGTSNLPQIPAFTSTSSDSALQQSTEQNGVLQIGAPAYNFTLYDIDGNTVQLTDFAGRSVILNFWATWCEPCRDEMPELEAAFQAYQKDELVVLAVNQRESREAVVSFFDELDLTFTPLLDAEGVVATVYGIGNMLPTTVFINGEGVVTAVHRGPLNQSQIDTYLLQEVP